MLACELTDYMRTKDFTPNTMLAMRQIINDTSHEVLLYKSLGEYSGRRSSQHSQRHVCNGRSAAADGEGQAAHIQRITENAVLANYRKKLDGATKFIPTWVKVVVALALGLGTMIGWKRIVVTVGEKIGKEHLDLCAGRVG